MGDTPGWGFPPARRVGIPCPGGGYPEGGRSKIKKAMQKAKSNTSVAVEIRFGAKFWSKTRKPPYKEAKKNRACGANLGGGDAYRYLRPPRGGGGGGTSLGDTLIDKKNCSKTHWI